jgi:hypothetical protein
MPNAVISAVHTDLALRGELCWSDKFTTILRASHGLGKSSSRKPYAGSFSRVMIQRSSRMSNAKIPGPNIKMTNPAKRKV